MPSFKKLKEVWNRVNPAALFRKWRFGRIEKELEKARVKPCALIEAEKRIEINRKLEEENSREFRQWLGGLRKNITWLSALGKKRGEIIGIILDRYDEILNGALPTTTDIDTSIAHGLKFRLLKELEKGDKLAIKKLFEQQ